MASDLDEGTIQAVVTGRFGSPLKFFDEVGSTNTVALEWADEDAPEGAIVVTDHQTAGRGRWGRTWFSEPGTALQFSLILRPRTSVDATGLLTGALGVACAEGIEAIAGVPAQIKWPNDVIVGAKKIAGILVESKVAGRRLEVAVAGIGINVTWPASVPDDIAARATSLDRAVHEPIVLPETPIVASAGPASGPATGEVGGAPSGSAIEEPNRLDRSRLLAAILHSFERIYSFVKHPGNRDELVRRIEARSAIVGKEVVVRFADGTTLRGRASRITRDGGLAVEAGDVAHELQVGEIEQIRET